jgi:uncharacterized protein YyaL (SSP411 family)
VAPAGNYYLTADDAEGLIVRPSATSDDATPNHNAIIAQNLIRLAVLTGDDTHRERADRLLAALAPHAAANPFAHAATLNAVDFRIRTIEIVITGSGSDADALAEAARALPNLNRITLRAESADALPPSHPARAKAAGGAAAFVCVAQSCSLPIRTPEALIKALD